MKEDERLIRMKEVKRIISLSSASIYRRIRDGKFPAPIKDGNCSFWEESKVREYVLNLSQRV